MGWEGYEMEHKAGVEKPNLTLFRGSSCVGEPVSNAAQCIRTGPQALRTFVDILNQDEGENSGSLYPLPAEHWINSNIEGEDGHTLLTFAIQHKLPQFVQVLLKAGAQANLFNADLNKYPIHVAATAGDTESLSLLLSLSPGTNQTEVNAINRLGRTALHLAVDRNDIDMVHLLVNQAGADLNLKTKKGGETPLYLAVKNKSPQVVELLLEHGASLDCVAFGKSIRAHIAEKMPQFDLTGVRSTRAPLEREMSVSTTELLVSLIDKASLRGQSTQADLDLFRSLILQLDVKRLTGLQSGGLSLLQKCCVGGLHEYVEALLGEGVDPNHCPAEALAAPVLIAAYRGRLKVLQVLHQYRADFSLVKKQTEETVLHRLLIKDENIDAPELTACLQFLLSPRDEELRAQVDRIINKKDVLGNTALHYATQKWDQATVRLLLERGANIGIKNKWGEIPIEKIEPETMEAFLDEFCLQARNDPNHEDFELTFRYNFLAPPVENLPPEIQGPFTEEQEKISSLHSQRRFALPETESLWYMAQTKEHRYLLKHPVITSFLWCKWNRIRRYFNRNLRFYFMFVTLLTWYVFEAFGGESIRSEEGRVRFWYAFFVFFSVTMLIFILKDWASDVRDPVEYEKVLDSSDAPIQGSESRRLIVLILSNWPEVAYLAGLSVMLWQGADGLYVALLILLTGLAAREIFQIAVSLRRYLLDLENWMEVLMIILTYMILLRPDPEPGTQPEELESSNYERELKRHLAAISLLLSWAELITFVAKHPRMNIYNVYVTMFYKVLSTFFFFLLWYIFFILAFGLGFYIILHKDFKDSNRTESDYKFFNSPGLSLVKVSTMFIGELEFSDIPVNLESSLAPLSYLFFLTFVFLIVVVLMNLLNGLAVSDTGAIQERSEIVSYLSRVETISYAESLLLGDPFDFLSAWPRLNCLLRVPSFSFFRQFYRNRTTRRIFQSLTGATNILLFYNYLPEKHLTVKPNGREDSCTVRRPLPQDILDSARRIIVGKCVKERASQLELKMERIERKLDLLLTKL